MVNAISISDVDTNEYVNITKYGDEYFVLDSIDWDTAAITMSTYELPKQIGASVVGVAIGTRKPKITGYVVGLRSGDTIGSKTWKEYFEAQQEIIEQNKVTLNRLLNPLRTLRIVAGEYYLEGRVSTLPKYSTSEEENNEVMCKFTVEFTCFNPMFRKLNANTILFTEREDKFRFPWVIKKTGNIFGVIIRNSLMTVTNSGDIETGAIIEMIAEGGEVKNPSFFDAETNEMIKIEYTLQSGDRLIINTNTGSESVTVMKEDSGEEVVLGYMTDDSVFVQIKRGLGTYGYSADGETAVFLKVTVTIEEQMFTIETL